ncbi:MAG TPA: hypothetical protein VFQ43_15555 [Nitrososphaera sp.]|nr:hypothetical protein [Nitrososphaera sp.]
MPVMSADLNIARQKITEARQTAGRTLENRFLDLCKAVEHIITHLQKSQKESKDKKQ